MTVPLSALAAHAIAAIALACIPIGAWFWLRRRFDLAWRDIGVGAAVFALFVLVLERTLHVYLLQLNPVTAQWLRVPALFVIYGTLMAGLFEESGRWLGLRFLTRRPGDAATPVAYALGHAGIEAWLVGVASQAQVVMFGIAANRGDLDARLAASGAEAMTATIHALLAQLSPWLAAGAVAERIAAMLVQFALTLVVWHAVRQRRPVLLGLAIVLHALADLPAALYQVHAVPLVVTEGIYTVIALLLAATCWPPQGGRTPGTSPLR
ncbi:YhfC family intramembrane metalloprotease [Ralstonia pseudosolanacearum]|uniref:Putative lipoprotein transmembrane n=1 Tax=Ralstonia solanacearum TaxID=305 RepID=A0A0S4TVG6_RALSL|nr:YhfC family intramembrane metalloprotease [Ralstonia pseudosolanacearum]OAI75748.1 membrane protein [Ralstonia solanacearum]QCX51518.1 YhfC family intramembrane metalloprotease [Ralstonia pseudosolanacearum]CUV13487.1 putative lipoprotein transmembrane [Ralstonia solanacearum]